MNRMPTQKRVVFLQLDALRVILFVLHCCVAGSWSAFFFGFRTFERNNYACAFFRHVVVPSDDVLKIQNAKIQRLPRISNSLARKYYRISRYFVKSCQLLVFSR